MAKILVVDDDPVMQLMIRRVLEQAGHAITVAADGSKGFARSQAESFDLLLLDIFMPGMDGFETMRRVLERQPNLPIIMISGRPHTPEMIQEPDYLTMALKLGAVSTLPKPFKPNQLLTMVANCLASANQPVLPPRPNLDALPNS